MKLKVIFGLLVLALLASTALAQRGRDGTVNIIYWQAPSILNPYLSGGTKDVYAASIIIEPLARYDVDGNIVPWLAAEIPTLDNGGIAEDLRSITWKLKPGVLWSDGTPFTAEDVVFTAEYCMSPEAGCVASNFFADVESVEALDDLTVKISFNVPKPVPYQAFVGAESPVLQKAQFEDCVGIRAQECSAQNFGPIGTGPFVIAEFRPNDVGTYEANPNFREADKPYFQTVVIKGGGDAASAARAVLETGEADWAWNLQVAPEVLSRMEAAGMGTITTAFGTNVERVLVNFSNPDSALGENRAEYMDGNNPHPFLTDYNVRRALSRAIDVEILVEIGYGPTGTTTCNLIPAPAIYASTANDECLTQDLEEANRLLDEAGWMRGADGVRSKDGVRLSMLFQTSTNAVRQDFQALLKEWWESIGFEVELKNVDAGVFFGNDISSPDTYGKFWTDLQMFTSGASGTDIESYLGRWTCAEIGGRANQWLSSNQHRWCNEEYDALALELAQTVDIEARAELIMRMNDMMAQDYVVFPLVYRGSVAAHANSLMGTANNAFDSELWNIADWYRGQ